MCLVAAKEEQISEEKSTPGDRFKEIEASEDPSSIGISLMRAGGLATSEQLEGQGDGSKTPTSPSHRVCFNVPSKKGSQ